MSNRLNPGPLLVLGFGPFAEVRRNPSGALAEAVDGVRLAGRTVHGRVLPVSYRRGAALALGAVAALEPALVVATGVAVRRARVEVERYAHPPGPDAAPDVDGVGPEPGAVGVYTSTVDVEGFAAVLGGAVSEDAGAYVCNALYHALLSGVRGPPVVFVHIPRWGLPPGALLAALAWLLDQEPV